MFEFIRRHTRLLQFILVLLIFPSFVFFGIQGYSNFSDGSREAVAKVDGREITRAEWDAAHRAQIERMRGQMPGVDVSLLDTPEMRQATLEGLLRERVVAAAANRLHLVTGDDRLQRLFVNDPELAFLRKPDGSLDKDALMSQGMTSEQLAERLRTDYSLRQVFDGIQDSVIAPAVPTDAALDALFQQREVNVRTFNTKDYEAKQNPSDAELQAYYKNPANAAQFRAPEQASIEYLVLDLAAVSKGITVPEEELRKYYSENQARYTTPEERRASHILVKVDSNAPAAQREKAKAKAESLLAEARKAPNSFAELAKKHSEDPGSAERGGDLDFFGRGAMVKPFEDAAFSMKPGDISGVVESDFGYHIINLTEVRGGQKKPFEAARAEIEAEARKQQAQKRFAELAEQFSNIVYEQPDSLKPAAEKLGLEVRTATVQRQPTPEATGPLASPKLLEAVFSSDALNNKRNTEAIETGPSELVSARVVQHTPERMRPFEEVKDKVRQAVVRDAAIEQARKAGQAYLAIAKTDAGTEIAGAAKTVSRAQPGDLPQPVIDAVLRAPADKLPTWIGVDLGAQGYAVARINKVLGRDPAVADPKQARTQYAQAWTAAESEAYYEALKDRYDAEILASAKSTSGTDEANNGR
jgi:peptidyl-prolyl cis-trans isomerase D